MVRSSRPRSGTSRGMSEAAGELREERGFAVTAPRHPREPEEEGSATWGPVGSWDSGVGVGVWITGLLGPFLQQKDTGTPGLV